MSRSGRSWKKLPNQNRDSIRAQRHIQVRKLSAASEQMAAYDSGASTDDICSMDSNEIYKDSRKSRWSSLDAVSPSLSYHPSSAFCRISGYMGNLSSSQKEALDDLREQVSQAQSEKGLNFSVITDFDPPSNCSEDTDLCLLRFLRSQQFDVSKTLSCILSNIEWREKVDTTRIRSMKPSDVLNVKENEMKHIISSFYPHWLLGYDRCGQPILLYSYGKFDTKGLLKHTTLQNLEAYHIWEQEKNAQLMARRSKELGHIVETINLVLDVKGLGVGQITGDLISLLQFITETDAQYYPFRNGTTYIINTPPFFNLIWGTLKGVFEGASSDIRIYSNQNEWKQVLRNEIGAERLPREYGGEGASIYDYPFLYEYHCQSIEPNCEDNLEICDSTHHSSTDNSMTSEIHPALCSVLDTSTSSVSSRWDRVKSNLSNMSIFPSLDPEDNGICVRLLFPELESRKTSHFVNSKPRAKEDSFMVNLLFGSN